LRLCHQGVGCLFCSVGVNKPHGKQRIIFVDQGALYCGRAAVFRKEGGSACGKGRKSYVLKAMGLRDIDIAGALRISLSRYTTREEIDEFLIALGEARVGLKRK